MNTRSVLSPNVRIDAIASVRTGRNIGHFGLKPVI